MVLQSLRGIVHAIAIAVAAGEQEPRQMRIDCSETPNNRLAAEQVPEADCVLCWQRRGW